MFTGDVSEIIPSYYKYNIISLDMGRKGISLFYKLSGRSFKSLKMSKR